MVNRTEVQHKVRVHVFLMILNQTVDRCILELEVLPYACLWVHHTEQNKEGNRFWTEWRNRLVGKSAGAEEVSVGSDSKANVERQDFLFSFALPHFFELIVDFFGRSFHQHGQRDVLLLFSAFHEYIADAAKSSVVVEICLNRKFGGDGL